MQDAYSYLFIERTYRFSQHPLVVPMSFTARKPIDLRRVLKGSMTMISNAITVKELSINIV